MFCDSQFSASQLNYVAYMGPHPEPHPQLMVRFCLLSTNTKHWPAGLGLRSVVHGAPEQRALKSNPWANHFSSLDPSFLLWSMEVEVLHGPVE